MPGFTFFIMQSAKVPTTRCAEFSDERSAKGRQRAISKEGFY